MPRFSTKSKSKLHTCDERLIGLFNEVVKHFDRFHYFSGYVLGIASQMGLNIRWGGDWDQDTQTKDNKFDDLVHFEIKE